MAEPEIQSPLPVPAVAALKLEAGGREIHRSHMERTISEDFRVEKEDLKEAAEHSQNVIVNLSLDGVIRFVTPSWQEVIGTSAESVVGKPISDVVIENKSAFQEAIAELQRDDSRSQVIRFSVAVGPLSSFRRKLRKETSEGLEETSPDGLSEEAPMLSLEAQGIMVYDRVSGGESNVSSFPLFSSTAILTSICRLCG
jgi:serine/threonine-protein kinase RIM15